MRFVFVVAYISLNKSHFLKPELRHALNKNDKTSMKKKQRI